MTYLQRVQAQHEATLAEQKLKQQKAAALNAGDWLETHRPLKERLAALLTSVPDEVKTSGISLYQLQVQLRGRTASKPHPGELAVALRDLGYKRCRVWKQSETTGFNAIWKANP